LDVRDSQAAKGWIEAAESVKKLDLLIANAGISAGIGGGGEEAEQVQRIFATNVGGVLNVLLPAIPAMMARKQGHLAIIGSLAGVRGLPSAPAYSASKAAVMAYGDALRGWLSAHGVKVSVICPGYIRTPMTDKNPFPMPFMMEADEAAKKIVKGLEAGKGRIAFPLALYGGLKLLAFLPSYLTDIFFSRLPAKPSMDVPVNEKGSA
jgi:short-subunit dehydrogenase